MMKFDYFLLAIAAYIVICFPMAYKNRQVDNDNAQFRAAVMAPFKK